MLNYIIRRILIIPVLLIGISLLVFSMISLMKPMDRVQMLFTTDIPNRPRDFEGLIKKYGLDDPFYVQYWNWMVGREDPESGQLMGGILYGNFGWSIIGRSSVADIIARRGPATLELVLYSLLPMIGVSIWMGIKAAVNHNKFLDHVIRISAVTGWSMPAFVFGLLLLLYFSSELHWFAPGRLNIELSWIVQSDQFVSYTNLYTIDALLNSRIDIFLDALKHLVLPVITLSVASGAFLLRITRFSMLETLRQDYITTARSKGLPEEMILRRHALPNALIPVITVGGLTLIGLLNSVVITEMIFNYPGLGSFLAESASALDLVSVAGVTMVSSIILVLGNLIVDVMYVVIDPRIRLD